ncbi:hypothetical protein SAMN05216490_0653 [Mucilaginibacter mallensis]|uniref:Uncharacterized protein n=1 Tax=Mucilaginibacter mallensis TaxID=652787 RepID=A0A1H1PYW3_MUCMA|nr:hypothetical protein [Mucilaginibacter mallensis]SDS16412.1 hypothetical protein SAMN05216490_0653 [Mucilaginibacter mallensis]
MFEDYELAILRDYREKKSKGDLLNNMMHPTPAKLKKESVAVFDRRYQRGDEVMLRSFFELSADTETFRLAIKKWETDKFRPLNLVLNKGPLKTDEKNIELLAWLIDFKPRPYALWLNDQKSKTETTPVKPEEKLSKEQDPPAQADQEEVGETEKGLPDTTTTTGGTLKRTPPVLVYGVLIAVIALMGYVLLKHRTPAGGEKCMYWTGDHYELIACNERPDDTTVTVIGLDSNKMIHFRRITRADTLTAASIGKVWYIKINDSIEYYTAPGEHPIHPERRLLPLTAHILNIHPRKPG